MTWIYQKKSNLPQIWIYCSLGPKAQLNTQRVVLIFNYYIVNRWKNAERKWDQCVIQLLQKQHKELPRRQNYSILPLLFESSWKIFQPTPHLYVNQSKLQIWQTLNNGLKWYMACVFLFCVKSIFAIHLYMSHQSVQTLYVSQFKLHTKSLKKGFGFIKRVDIHVNILLTYSLPS